MKRYVRQDREKNRYFGGFWYEFKIKILREYSKNLIYDVLITSLYVCLILIAKPLFHHRSHTERFLYSFQINILIEKPIDEGRIKRIVNEILNRGERVSKLPERIYFRSQTLPFDSNKQIH